MKDSGVEWLGPVPEHWEVTTVRRLFRAVTRKDITGDEPKMSMSRHLGLVRSSELGGRSSQQSDSLSYSVCHPNDLVMNKYQAHAGLFGCAVERGLITPNYTVFRPAYKANTLYYAELFRSLAYRTAFEIESYGVGDGMAPLYTNVFYRVPVVVPPLTEQSSIVRYLNHVDRRVRRLVRAKRKMIALLTEQKQAIIHLAVTRGLDPDVPLELSGLPWCPQVPAHWDLKPNRAFLRLRKVLVGERHTEYTLLSLTKKGVIVRDLSENKGKFSSDMGTSQEVRAGDLVMCLFDVPETPRTVGLSKHSGMITGAYTVFEPRDEDVVEWLERFYIAMDDRKLLSPLYSGLRNTIPKPRFLGAKTPIPTSPERAGLISSIQEMEASTEAAVARAQHEIELLEEYQTRLIADVVTGKLDVREAAAALPEAYPGDSDGITDEAEAASDQAEHERLEAELEEAEA